MMKSALHVSMMVVIAGLTMGNKGCKETASERVLKMDVELSALKGRSIRLPTGELVDFPFVVNQHFYRQVMNNDHFTIINAIPSSENQLTSTATGVYAKASNESSATGSSEELSQVDIDVLNEYGFLKQLKDPAIDSASESHVSEKTASSAEYTKLPICLYDMPQSFLGGDVFGFEASWGAGLGIGYGVNGDLNSGTVGNVGGSVDFSSSRLELGLRTDDPLTREVQIISDGVSHQQSVKFRFNFLPGIPVGLSFFYNESLSSVIRDGLDRALDALVAAYVKRSGSWDEVWESRVLFDPEIADNDTRFAIRGGVRAEMKIGDEFKITNMHYVWEGGECYSRLKYKIPRTDQPSVEIKIIALGDNVAIGELKDPVNQPDVRIIPGAQVKISKLWKPDPKASAATK